MRNWGARYLSANINTKLNQYKNPPMTAGHIFGRYIFRIGWGRSKPAATPHRDRGLGVFPVAGLIFGSHALFSRGDNEYASREKKLTGKPQKCASVPYRFIPRIHPTRADPCSPDTPRRHIFMYSGNTIR